MVYALTVLSSCVVYDYRINRMCQEHKLRAQNISTIYFNWMGFNIIQWTLCGTKSWEGQYVCPGIIAKRYNTFRDGQSDTETIWQRKIWKNYRSFQVEWHNNYIALPKSIIICYCNWNEITFGGSRMSDHGIPVVCLFCAQDGFQS